MNSERVRGMAWCPSCRSEYRVGFTVCKVCGDVPLVERLDEVDELRDDEIADAEPVGVSTIAHVIDFDGRKIDLTRAFVLGQASEIETTLLERAIACKIVPVGDLPFPDQQMRFEVRVRASDRAKADAVLIDLWRARVGAEGVEAPLDTPEGVDGCPACGAHVPLEADTCPDCGLVVGASEEADVHA